MNVSLELIFTIVCQFVLVVGFFASLRERVRRLEDDSIKLQKAVEETREHDVLIAKIDAKLDLLITHFSQKRGVGA